MTTTATPRLSFGYNGGLPEGGTAAAWGARLIYPNDLLPDRTDTFGEPDAKARLFDLLNTRAPLPRDYPPILAEKRIRENDTTGTLYEDDELAVKARACGGYLYVVAYLKGGGS